MVALLVDTPPWLASAFTLSSKQVCSDTMTQKCITPDDMTLNPFIFKKELANMA